MGNRVFMRPANEIFRVGGRFVSCAGCVFRQCRVFYWILYPSLIQIWRELITECYAMPPVRETAALLVIRKMVFVDAVRKHCAASGVAGMKKISLIDELNNRKDHA
ncbi:hypothetical protein [Herbaspirillum chlorophenolicum]|uniref:hypothetical protein n=2 Tax=Herbaspirillum chlorophenolicum TaxID=211589 RepID=UPI0018CC8623|nr:hypothetical protein [Herbaspirillum chlorophenolicum]